MAKDFVRDANPRPLYKAMLSLDLPDYLEAYSIPTVEEIEKLASAAFADQALRLHPVYCKEAAILSGLYLVGTGLGNTEQMEYVKQAASIFGVSEDLRRLVTDLLALDDANNPEKKASSDEELSNNDAVTSSSYAVFVCGEDNLLRGYYPIDNEVNLTKSARNLYDDFMENKFPADWAHKAATTIVQKAQEFGLSKKDLPERVWVLGTERVPDFITAEKLAAMRTYDGVDDEAVSLYKDIVKAAANDPDNLDEYIKLWSDLDYSNGVRYSDTFTPHEAFYTGPATSELEKYATECVLIGDVAVPQFEFAAVTNKNIDGYFRQEIADVIKSAAELARTGSSAIATKYIDQLDKDNQDQLLRILISE